MSQMISKNIKQHAKFENSYLKSLGLDDWSVEARSSFTVGLNRWIDKIAAQQTDLATMNKWFTTDFAKLLTQFRTFSLQAYEKQLLNGIYTLHQTRGKDFETWSRFFSSTLMAGLFYTTQIYINSFGLTYNDGLYTATIPQQQRTSTDGITWALRTSGFGSTTINAIAYGNNNYVIVVSTLVQFLYSICYRVLYEVFVGSHLHF